MACRAVLPLARRAVPAETLAKVAALAVAAVRQRALFCKCPIRVLLSPEMVMDLGRMREDLVLLDKQV